MTLILVWFFSSLTTSWYWTCRRGMFQTEKKEKWSEFVCACSLFFQLLKSIARAWVIATTVKLDVSCYAEDRKRKITALILFFKDAPRILRRITGLYECELGLFNDLWGVADEAFSVLSFFINSCISYTLHLEISDHRSGVINPNIGWYCDIITGLLVTLGILEVSPPQSPKVAEISSASTPILISA